MFKSVARNPQTYRSMVYKSVARRLPTDLGRNFVFRSVAPIFRSVAPMFRSVAPMFRSVAPTFRSVAPMFRSVAPTSFAE